MFKLRKLIPCYSIKFFTPETMCYYGNYDGGLGYGYNGLGCSYGGYGCGYGCGYGGLGCGFGWGNGIYGCGGSRPSWCRRYCSYGFYWEASKETQPPGPRGFRNLPPWFFIRIIQFATLKSQHHPKVSKNKKQYWSDSAGLT